MRICGMGAAIFTLLLTGAASHAEMMAQSRAGHFLVTARSHLDPPATNRMHSWTLHVVDAAGQIVEDASIEVVGGMPDHDHGLPTAPRVTAYLGGGDYLLEGMRFHMNGGWRIELTLRTDDVTDVAVFEIEL
ncbi:MAG TPA: FixH family protein [Pseudomonadales bacterium]